VDLGALDLLVEGLGDRDEESALSDLGHWVDLDFSGCVEVDFGVLFKS